MTANQNRMNSLMEELHRMGRWPIYNKRFIAYRDNDGYIITIKQNKVGLLILRCDGTLIGSSTNDEVMKDMLKTRKWASLQIP